MDGETVYPSVSVQRHLFRCGQDLGIVEQAPVKQVIAISDLIRPKPQSLRGIGCGLGVEDDRPFRGPGIALPKRASLILGAPGWHITAEGDRESISCRRERGCCELLTWPAFRRALLL